MVNVTYTTLLDPAAICSVRPPSLRVIYVADMYLISIDYPAVWFEAQPLTYSSGTLLHFSLDLPEKP
jgi:hypothetical protein